MSDIDTLNTNTEDHASSDNFDEQYVDKAEFDKIAKKAEDQEKARIKLAAELKELKEKAKVGSEPEIVEETKQTGTDAALLERLDRQDMALAGYTSQAEQDVISNASKALGVSIQEAMSKSYVVKEIEEMRQEKKVEDATNIKGSGGGDNPTAEEGLKRNFLNKGQMPESAADKMKLLEMAQTDPEIQKALTSE